LFYRFSSDQIAEESFEFSPEFPSESAVDEEVDRGVERDQEVGHLSHGGRAHLKFKKKIEIELKSLHFKNRM
jgi:hypothetical protein